MFIKYGAEGHLRALMEQGQMYMNPCKYFRDLEASQLLKGIGDCNDGGIITDEGNVVLKHRNGSYYEIPNQSIAFIVEPCLHIPVFCLKQSERSTLSLADREVLREQFPTHTHALVIDDEFSFFENIRISFAGNAFCHSIFYQDKFFVDFLEFLEGGKSDVQFNNPKPTPRYYAEMISLPNDPNDRAHRFRIDDTNYFKTMFRKGTFFESQKEYRIVLPYERVDAGKIFNIQPIKAKLYKIDDLVQ